MEPTGKDGGPAAPAPALTRQLSYTCSRGRAEPMHDRKLSYSYSFSTPAASPSSTSSSSARYLPPLSSKSSCDSISTPVPDLEKQSSFSSASSYESFFQLEAATATKLPEFAPPPIQTMMMAQGQHAGGVGAASAAVYDPKRLPPSMFRTPSKSPAEWSVTSNDSLFSIQLGHSGEIGTLYGELYYDAAGGFHRHPSLPAVKGPSAGDAGGGLCVRDDCVRCSSGGKNRKSVRFAAVEVVPGESKHAAVFPMVADVLEEAAETASGERKAAGAGADGCCMFGCCSPSAPSMWWWPRCACCDCRCRDCGWL